MATGWKDKLELWSNRGVYGITWIVWDDDDGEIEGAVVGESRPELDECDKEYAAVHRAVEAFWKSNPDRAEWVKNGFWFEHETNARKALAIGRKALAECRAQPATEREGV